MLQEGESAACVHHCCMEVTFMGKGKYAHMSGFNEQLAHVETACCLHLAMLQNVL